MNNVIEGKRIAFNEKKGNLKKSIFILCLLIFIGIGLILSAPGFCATNVKFNYAEETKAVYEIRHLSAVEYKEPDLSHAITREEGVCLLSRYFELDSKAYQLTDEETGKILNEFKDANMLKQGLYSKKIIAFAIKNNYISGVSNKILSPQMNMDGKTFCTIALRMMGYSVNVTDYDIAAAILSEKGGLTVRQAVKFNYKPLINDDAYGILYSIFNAKTPDGKTLIKYFSEKGLISIENAQSYGFDIK